MEQQKFEESLAKSNKLRRFISTVQKHAVNPVLTTLSLNSNNKIYINVTMKNDSNDRESKSSQNLNLTKGDECSKSAAKSNSVVS